jgi:hypothetical protein
MANYGYVATELDLAAADALLREVVAARFGGRVLVEEKVEWLSDHPGSDRIWLIYAPHTAVHDEREAMGLWVAPGDDCGFVVGFEGGSYAFRHSVNEFDRWLYGAVEHSLASRLSTTVHYDATDRDEPVREYMLRGGFRAYLDYVYEDLAIIQRRLVFMPKTWDDALLDPVGVS